MTTVSKVTKVTSVRRGTDTTDAGRARMSGALHLVAMGDGVVIQLPLPASGEVAIGRGKDVDARLDAPSISRRHALLRIENEYEITIEDLGSANGTRVRGQALVKGMPVSLRLGEVADVGALVISIQHHVRTDRARRIWSHAFFEAHLEEACLRIQHAGDAASFAVLGIRGTFDEAVLSAALRPVDVVGLYAPGEYEVILVDVTEEAARDLVQHLRGVLGRNGCVPRRSPCRLRRHHRSVRTPRRRRRQRSPRV